MIRQQIFIEGFELEVAIGIHDFERTSPQRIVIDIELDVAFDPAQLRDEIDSVLDYDFLRQEIAALVTNRQIGLQETLCLEIVRLLARRPQVQAATVSTRKPDVYPDCDAVGVRMRYQRD